MISATMLFFFFKSLNPNIFFSIKHPKISDFVSYIKPFMGLSVIAKPLLPPRKERRPSISQPSKRQPSVALITINEEDKSPSVVRKISANEI